MTRKNRGRRGEKDADPDTERGPFARAVEWVVVFVLCCFLVMLGVNCVLAVRIPLIIISVILATIFIIYRVCRRRDRDDY